MFHSNLLLIRPELAKHFIWKMLLFYSFMNKKIKIIISYYFRSDRYILLVAFFYICLVLLKTLKTDLYELGVKNIQKSVLTCSPN